MATRALGLKTLSMRGGNSGSLLPNPPAHTKLQNEELQRMNADLNLLSQKLIELQNESNGKLVSSSFVNGIRETTSNSATVSVDANSYLEVKMTIMEKLISKMTEIDRYILRGTEATDDTNESTGDPTHKPAKRRASRGLDMSTFPTHLHIIDRLMDIHKKAQRVAIITKNGVGVTQPAAAAPTPVPTVVPVTATLSPETKTQISALEAQVTKLTSQLKESEDLSAKERKAHAAAIAALKEETEKQRIVAEASTKKAIENAHTEGDSMLQEQLKHLNETVEAMTRNGAATAIQVRKLEDESAERVKQSSNNIKQLEERLEQEIGSQEKLLHMLMSISNKIETHCDTDFLSDTDEASVSPEAFSVVSILVSTVITRLDELCTEINNATYKNDELQDRIASYDVERDMVQKDMDQLTFLNNNLRAEKLALQNDCSKKHIDTNEEVLKELEKEKDKNRKTSSELAAASMQVAYLETYKEQINKLEQIIISNQLEADGIKMKLENALTTSQEETTSYKRLTEELKRKLRELGSKSGTDAKDFLDTFEEVMKEEMMSMKGAFESRLKRAQAESDETARRHANEIRNLQALNSSPSTKSLYNGSKMTMAATSSSTSGLTNSSTSTGGGSSTSKYTRPMASFL